MKETYAPILLERKASHLRKETENPALLSCMDTGKTPKALFKLAIVRPLKLLFLQPIVLIISLCIGIVFAYIFLLFTTFPAVFEEQYHFSASIVGLSYLGLGVGMVLGLVTFSAISDRLLRKMTKRANGKSKPEYRLPIMMLGTTTIPIGLFWYGWSAYSKVHWIVPIIGTSFVGFGMMMIFLPVQVYLIDAFTEYAASAMAAGTVCRAFIGAFLPLAGPAMYSSLGLGWGNSLLGFVAMAFFPMPILLYKYGGMLRQKYNLKL